MNCIERQRQQAFHDQIIDYRYLAPQRKSLAPAQDALDLMDGFFSGEYSFQYVYVRLIELGCSPAVIGAFFHEAIEEARR